MDNLICGQTDIENFQTSMITVRKFFNRWFALTVCRKVFQQLIGADCCWYYHSEKQNALLLYVLHYLYIFGPLQKPANFGDSSIVNELTCWDRVGLLPWHRDGGDRCQGLTLITLKVEVWFQSVKHRSRVVYSCLGRKWSVDLKGTLTTVKDTLWRGI